MREEIQLELPWPPLSGNRQSRSGQGRYYTPAPIVKYRQLVAREIERIGMDDRRIDEPVSLMVFASPPDKRARDADNVLKVLLDALVRGGLLSDDSCRVIRKQVFEWCPPVSGGSITVVIQLGLYVHV